MSRDDRWLADVVRRAETLDEAKLAVSVYLAARLQLPLRVPATDTLRLVEANPCTKTDTSNT